MGLGLLMANQHPQAKKHNRSKRLKNRIKKI